MRAKEAAVPERNEMRAPRAARWSLPLLALALSLGCRALQPQSTIYERRAATDRVVPELPVAVPFMVEHPEEALGQQPGPEGEREPELEAAASPIGGDELYSFEFRGTNLAQAIHLIAEAAGISVYMDPYAAQSVDVSFRATTLDDALRVLLDRNGLVLIEDPPGIYWVDVRDGSQPGFAQFVLESVTASDVATLLTDLIGESSKVVVDENQNMVFVKGMQRDIDTVAALLEKVDRLKRQVLIEVRLVEVSLDERFELGIAHRLDNLDLGELGVSLQQQLATGSDSLQAVFTGQDGDLETTLQALNRLVGVNLLSSPRLLAVTNTTATLNLVEEVPYINVTSTQSGSSSGVGSQVIQEVEFKEVGVKMEVTPSIQEGGVLKIKIVAELSEVVEIFNDIPVIDRRDINHEFLVGDRQTIVLGGVMQSRSKEIEEGVPGLMRIPALGRLFSNDVEVEEKRELIIFLTPRIVSPGEAASLTDAYRQEYRETVRSTGVRSIDEVPPGD